ncbi:hypothetical protein CBR_g4380 [Chara braunii]|uniref:Uncharacterized protein n=1 Tax=Chara braunii TaxID=69332 RepID=A0A388KHP4_CHABU|nr:hypothetical protein CBR_g4380 [Chara braunii]|eukprot:GBG69546.1 hypothetical protein CBR_g4380 [Chara braunii]
MVSGETEFRELLYNSNVIRTNEVMDAVKGQQIENFSLWPDVMSSWRWELSPDRGWLLTCVRWRFLLKKIFPELGNELLSLVARGHSFH